MKNQKRTHVCLTHWSLLCLFHKCFCLFYSWLWQDIFIVTSTVWYFLDCTIPFGCFPLPAGLYHNQNQRRACLHSRVVTHIYEFSKRIFDFEWNSHEFWWSNSIHVLLFVRVQCAVLVLLLCSSGFGVHYAFELPVRLLLSFHFDDCILIPISFSDQLSTNNEAVFRIRHSNINVPLLLFDAYQFEDEVFQFHSFWTIVGNRILELIGHNQLTLFSR